MDLQQLVQKIATIAEAVREELERIGWRGAGQWLDGEPRVRRAWLPPRGGRWRLPAGVVLHRGRSWRGISGAMREDTRPPRTERCAVGPERQKVSDALSENS